MRTIYKLFCLGVGLVFMFEDANAARGVMDRSGCLSGASNQELINELGMRLGAGAPGVYDGDLSVLATCYGPNFTLSVFNAVSGITTTATNYSSSPTACEDFAKKVNTKASGLKRGGRVATCYGPNLEIFSISRDGKITTSTQTMQNNSSCQGAADQVNL